jgi:2-oxoacid:acceptor oxidoreductase gamma subunit (pyruvate/2-ketoisovalerate family)
MSEDTTVYNIRFHARGGQGGVTAAQLCVDAYDGYGVCQPRFGAERVGAPTESYARLSKNKEMVRTNEQVYSPQFVGVLDPTLLDSVNVTAGMAPGGTLIVNTTMSIEEIRKKVDRKDINIARLDATCLALEYLGRNVTNTIILGALVKVSGLFTLDELGTAIMKTFKAKIAKKNVEVLKVAFEQTESDDCGVKLDLHYDGKVPWSHVELDLLGAKDLDTGAVWYKPGGSRVTRTSEWAVNIAQHDMSKCINCHQCVFVCPDFAIKREMVDGKWKVMGVKEDFCKGCFLCTTVCPKKALYDPASCEAEQAKGGN